MNKLKKLIIPENIKVIKENAFSINSLESVIFSKKTVTIEKEAFKYNQISSCIIPDGVSIAEDSFDLSAKQKIKK